MRPDLPDLLSWDEPRTLNGYLSIPPQPADPIPMSETTPFSLLIDGQPVTTAATLDVINPATGRFFAHCPGAGAADLDAAVKAARRAFPAWRALGFAARAEC